MIYIGSKVPITPKEKSIALQEIHSIFQLHSIIFSYPVWLEYYSTPLDIWAYLLSHYYRNADLFRLGNPCCPGFPTGNAGPGQKGVPFCPGSGNRDKRGPFVLVGNTNRDKRCSQRPRGWRTLLSRLVTIFFSCFSFLNSFSISIILLHFN